MTPQPQQHCDLEGICNDYAPPWDDRNISCDGKDHNTGKTCFHDTRSKKVLPIPAKECIGRFDECRTWDDKGCECVAYCIMAANNARSRPAPSAPELPIATCNICDLARGCEINFGKNGYPPCVYRAIATIRKDERNQTLEESDKEWKSFEDWLINTPFPQDSRKMVAKILKKTCSIRESLRRSPEAKK